MASKYFNHILTFYDKVLIILIVVLVIVLYGITALNTQKSPDDIVVVRQNGDVIYQLSKEEIMEDGIYAFEFNGGIGQLEVKDSKVRMLPMDKNICPQGICSETGWIDGSPKSIVCIPNRLIVSFNNDSNSKIDGVAF